MNRKDSLLDMISQIPMASECLADDMQGDGDPLKMFEVTDDDIDAIIKEVMMDEGQQQTCAQPSQPDFAATHAQQAHVQPPSYNQQVVQQPMAFFNNQVVPPQHGGTFNQQVVPGHFNQHVAPSPYSGPYAFPNQNVMPPPYNQHVAPFGDGLPAYNQASQEYIQHVVPPAVLNPVVPNDAPALNPVVPSDAAAHDYQEQPQASLSQDVRRVKVLLNAMTGDDDSYLENSDLIVVHKNISDFTDDELWMIPNVYLRGTGSLAVKNGCEVMMCVKMMCIDHGLKLRDVLLARFMSSCWLDCPCVNATGKNKGDVCERERRYGMLACSRHSLSMTKANICEYCAGR